MAKKRSQGENPARVAAGKSSSDGPEKTPSFPIVGIGASAGGFEAFKDLLRDLPEQTGIAFVLVQHLDPTHGSALPEILARVTKLPITQVSDGMVVEPGRVYVIPANTTMLIHDGALRLGARVLTHGQHMPIDEFFRSLADECGNRAIGVVLSGTASDGTEGCRAIKAAGGLTFAQEESSAKFSGMPHSAISAGCVDFVLDPKGIADELVRISHHPYVLRTLSSVEPSASLGKPPELETLLTMLQESSGVDFGLYKKTTLQRRIGRRMVVHRLEHIRDYVRYVQEHPEELAELYRDILIHVTEFFRDPGAFEALRQLVFPKIVQNRKIDSNPIRIWVPGCSTGEEVYSIAILMLEYLWESRALPQGSITTSTIQIFATDISDNALDRARAGLYSHAAVSQVSPERLRRFFLKLDGGYQINKALRELCIFARQNVTRDPPFSSLDLISCRNLLIYLGPALQNRVIPTVHNARKPDGILLLGGSESLGAFADHFVLIDKKHKIYEKKKGSARLLSYFAASPHTQRAIEAPSGKTPFSTFSVEKEVERVLLGRYIPASIVVNSDMEIIQFRGRTGAYVEPAEGHATFSLSKMVREGLLVDLRAALDRAKKQNSIVRAEGIQFKSNGGMKEVNFDVIPVQGQSQHERYYVVVFRDVVRSRIEFKLKEKTKGKVPSRDSRERREVDRLNRELGQAKEQIRSLIEDNESTGEEYKSANEEVLSANEELQSTNEELETAKEELQSSNEELTTLNEELQNRNVELSLANSDLTNLLGNVSLPVVMVGNDLRIRRFTPPAQKLLNLLPGDLGRRLGEIRPNLDYEDLERIVQEAIDTTTLQEREVQDKQRRWHLLRVRPYKTWDSKIEGAVISLQDLDSLKQSLQQTRMYADALIENAREAILILDQELRVAIGNPAFY